MSRSSYVVIDFQTLEFDSLCLQTKYTQRQICYEL